MRAEDVWQGNSIHAQNALSTRSCHFATAWNRPAPYALHLKITSSECLQPVLTTLRFLGAEHVGQGDSIHAQSAPPHPAEMGDESAKSKSKTLTATFLLHVSKSSQ